MTLIETDEPAPALASANGEGVSRLRCAACQTRIVQVVVTQDAQLVSWARLIAFVRDGRVVDQVPSSSGSGSLVVGEYR